MVLAAGLLLGACSNDNEPTDNANGVAAVFTTNLDGRVQTRMADEEWAEDDAIGIFSLNNEMQGVMIDGVEQSNNAVNLKYPVPRQALGTAGLPLSASKIRQMLR